MDQKTAEIADRERLGFIFRDNKRLQYEQHVAARGHQPIPLWLGMTNDGVQDKQRQDELTKAAEDIGAKPKAKHMGANTGAKGFAAILKANALKMREEFSKLADEMTGEFQAMQGHLETSRAQVAEMKADNKELREALGLENTPS